MKLMVIAPCNNLITSDKSFIKPPKGLFKKKTTFKGGLKGKKVLIILKQCDAIRAPCTWIKVHKPYFG